jgi:hypothetical protein
MNGNDEVKKEIERLKKEMNDYLKLSRYIKFGEDAIKKKN